MSHAVALRLYFRSGCGLCEEMRADLLTSQHRYGFALELIDVDGSTALVERYGHKVPVLTTPQDEEICHYFLDHNALAGYFSHG